MKTKRLNSKTTQRMLASGASDQAAVAEKWTAEHTAAGNQEAAARCRRLSGVFGRIAAAHAHFGK